MDPGGDQNLHDGMELSSRGKSRDSSRRPTNPASNKDSRDEAVRHDLFRKNGSKQAGSSADKAMKAAPASDSSKRVARSAASEAGTSGSLVQSSLSDFSQTAPTVSTLQGVGKGLKGSKNPLDTIKMMEVPGTSKKRMSLAEYQYQKSSSASALLGAGQASPVRKAASMGTESPSPPRARVPSTPLRDEAMEEEETLYQAERRRRRQYNSAQDFIGAEGQYAFFGGVPQGSSVPPQAFPHYADYVGGGQQFMDQAQQQVPLQQAPPQPPRAQDLIAVFQNGFSKVLDRIGDLSGNSASASVNSRTRPSTDNILTEVKQEVVSEDSSSEEEEQQFTSWAGRKLVNKTPTVVLSEQGVEAYKALKGVDQEGIAAGNAKKAARRDKDIVFYAKGNRAFYPPEKNLELPKLTGYKEQNEKKLVAKDKSLGAVAAAIVAAVDASRELVDDIGAARVDFENDLFEDPKREAIEVCGASAGCINDRIVGHLVKALKIVATESALITQERRTLAETEVGQEDMRKLLAESPPDETFLYGGAVKDTVQKARDATLLSKAFNRYGNNYSYGNNFGYSKKKAWDKAGNYRAKDLRFKPKKFGKFGDGGKFKGSKFNKFKKDRFKKE